MPLYLGIDTSNYTTSTALYNSGTGRVTQRKKLLPVKENKLGLRQTDAVFLHVRQLGALLSDLLCNTISAGHSLKAVGASIRPRDEEGSYMPCFLVGVMAAQASASTAGVPLHTFSHQAGHVAAALYSAGRLELFRRPFLAFHFSGGTTQCVLVRPDAENILKIATVSETLDLNAGQAIDRVGAMMGLSFPAGPALEHLAAQSGRQYEVKTAMKGVNCCLSGLQNQCGKMLAQGAPEYDVARYCFDYIAATAINMARAALELHPGMPLVFAGGVMSNKIIRSTIQSAFSSSFAEGPYSADNAAGIALLCALKDGGVPPC